MRNNNTLFLIIGIILVLAIVGGIIFGMQTSNNVTTNTNNITDLKAQLSSANSQVTTLGTQLAEANSQIASIKTQEATDISALQAQLVSITAQITTANATLTSLKTQEATDVAALQASLADLTNQVTAVNTQLTALKAQETADITKLTGQITSLQSTVTSLSTQVANLGSTGGNPSTLFPAQTYTQNFASVTAIYSFTPTYSGNVIIAGSSSSSTTFIRITNNNLNTSVDYTFGLGTTVTIPLIGGISYSISFGNTATSGTISANLTGTFYPSSTAGTTQTSLFSTGTFTQNPNILTLIYAFAPTANGTVYVTGSSSTVTGYIRVTNTSLGSPPTDYTFGTGTTVTFSVISGYNYSIFFGNTSTTTVTVTLNGTYYH
jgi:hypothetical protein